MWTFNSSYLQELFAGDKLALAAFWVHRLGEYGPAYGSVLDMRRAIRAL